MYMAYDFEGFSPELKALTEITELAGQMALSNSANIAVSEKPDGSSVTNIDQAINDFFISVCGDRLPDVTVMGEEGVGPDAGSGLHLFVDPIDDTNGLILGEATSYVSAGLVDKSGQVVLAAVNNPFVKKGGFIVSESSEGAVNPHRPDERLQVSDTQTIKNAQIAISTSMRQLFKGPNKELVESIYEQKARPTIIRGAVHKGIMVARGSVDAWVGRGLKRHDVAAVDLIIRESGGKVTDYDGNPLDYSKDEAMTIVASNGRFHDDLLDLVKTAA